MCVGWGMKGDQKYHELRPFGKGMRGIGIMPPAMDFTKYGVETLYGTRIESRLSSCTDRVGDPSSQITALNHPTKTTSAGYS